MKISVVIPLYNKAPYIKRALLSVLAQTFPDFEVIVVDDGSTDEGVKILNNISDFRIRLIQQENAGVSAARNRGIKEARADLIAFLDADDEWTPDHLKTIVSLRKRFPQAGAYGTSYEVHRPGKVTKYEYANIPPPPWEGLIPSYFKSAFGSTPINSSTVAIPKDVFSFVGYFPVGVRRGEDIFMWCKIALKYKIAFSHYLGAIYYFDIGKKNRTVEPSSHGILLQTYVNEINKREISRNLLADVKEYISRKEMQSAGEYLLRGEPKKVREILIHTHPKNIKSCFRKYWWLFWSMVPLRFFHFSFFFSHFGSNLYKCFPEVFKKKYRVGASVAVHTENKQKIKK